MGAFNVLNTEMECPDCKQRNLIRIQYKFGDTWLLEYNIGDMIKWGGNDIGDSDLNKVKAYGIAESTTCKFCKNNTFPEEYDIFIVDNVLQEVSRISNMLDYLGVNEGDFVVLE